MVFGILRKCNNIALSSACLVACLKKRLKLLPQKELVPVVGLGQSCPNTRNRLNLFSSGHFLNVLQYQGVYHFSGGIQRTNSEKFQQDSTQTNTFGARFGARSGAR